MNNNLFYIFLSTIIIAFAPVLSQLGVPVKGVWVYSFYTLFSAFIFIAIYTFFKKKKLVFSKNIVIMSFFNLLGIIFYFLSFNFLSAVSAGFLSQTQLFFTLIIAYFFLNEFLDFKKLVASVLVLTGGFIIYYNESISFNQLGVLYIILSMLFFSISNYFTKKLRDKVNVYSIMFFRNFFAVIILFIINLFFSFDSLFSFDNSIIFAVFQGFSSDFLGWTLFTFSLKHVNLNKAFIIYSFASVFTLIYSFLVFGVNIIPLQLVGGTFILIGNIIFNK